MNALAELMDTRKQAKRLGARWRNENRKRATKLLDDFSKYTLSSMLIANI